MNYKYSEPINIEKELYCNVCKNPLNEPVILKCGHMVCNKCIPEEFWIIDNYRSFCGVCENEFSSETVTFNIPHFVLDKLNNLNVLCLRCKSNENIKRVDFENHLNYHCRTECELGCGILLLESEVKNHNLVCENYYLECSGKQYHCPWIGPRKEYTDHINKCKYIKYLKYPTESNRELEEKLKETNKKLEETNLELEQSKEIVFKMFCKLLSKGCLLEIEAKENNDISN